MAVVAQFSDTELLPTIEDFECILSSKLSYEKAKATKTAAELDDWCRASGHFGLSPRSLSWSLSKKCAEKDALSSWKQKRSKAKPDIALRYYIAGVAVKWQEFTDCMNVTLSSWGYSKQDISAIANDVWLKQENLDIIGEQYTKAKNGGKIILTEAPEKHKTLNSKLFTTDEVLRDSVRKKMLEIVDEFLADLKDQGVKLKVDDILFIGSNASYNYTKNSDIDLHILANAKAVEYSAEICDALYSAYRSLFNKKLDIKLFGIPVELFVETENSSRVSNGVYSVKKNKWAKKPVPESIPEYDQKAIDKLVDEWENKYNKLVDEIKDGKLDNEKKVVKMLETIYDKLRKKGVAKGEYSTENLAFKELRNKGYLDSLKDFKNELISKRLSLEERLARKTAVDVQSKIARITHSQPIIQDNGMFFIYNIKASDVSSIVHSLRQLPFVTEVYSHENGKYDFSNVIDLAMNKMPKKYYDIRGRIDDTRV